MWVLASASPRRAELLTTAGAHFIVDPSDYVEENRAVPPEILTVTQALGKAKDVATRRADGMAVLGADTVVVYRGRIFGKPQSKEDAVRMLTDLADDWHEVWTGMALVQGSEVATMAVCTRVHMWDWKAHMEAYLRCGEWTDKAGGYGIQGRAAMWVDRIEGSYTNVVGLPMAETRSLFAERGIDWG